MSEKELGDRLKAMETRVSTLEIAIQGMDREIEKRINFIESLFKGCKESHSKINDKF